MKKSIVALLMGTAVLAAAGCGNHTADERVQQPASRQVQEQKEPALTGSAAAENSFKIIFQNSVFLGDSITEGLSFHDVLDEKNVLAGAGKTAEFALKDIDELTKRNPKQVFIHLGSDDILWPTDDPKAYSMNNYAKLIGMMKEKLPQARITLLTVTPVTEDAIEAEPRYKNIGDYNLAVKELADKENVGFADLSSIFSGDFDSYDSDGIHFKPEFYVKLLELLKGQME